MEQQQKQRWFHLSRLLRRRGPFADASFEPFAGGYHEHFLSTTAQVLVIGAGGLGCELLKDLALVGFRHLHVIDMDTIDVSNLNRQFLFRACHISQPKAVVAAQMIEARIPGVKVTAHYKRIQDMDVDFYRQFHFIVCGLDSLDARRWLNALLVQLVQVDEEGQVVGGDVIPWIDGGTEGFKGQARVIIPRMTACFECALDLYPPQTTFPLCTIANTPRLPEHCIEYAALLAWPESFPNEPLDMDNAEHVKWVCKTAQTRGAAFGIHGIDYRRTQGVVKHIIPAIASTNAIISAACAQEAFKLATRVSSLLDNYMLYNGTQGTYTHTFSMERRDNCPICSTKTLSLSVDANATVDSVLQKLREPPFRLQDPSLRCCGKSLYMPRPEALRLATVVNLTKNVWDLVQEEDVLDVTAFGVVVQVKLHKLN